MSAKGVRDNSPADHRDQQDSSREKNNLARPFVIWVSVVLPLLLALAAAYGLLLDVARLARWYQVARSIPLWRGGMATLVQACFVAFFFSVTYAALKRPRWGRVICAVFAVMVMAWIVWRAFTPIRILASRSRPARSRRAR